MEYYFQRPVTVLLSTLTTALLRPNTSAKPTTIFNRIFVDPNFVVVNDSLTDQLLDQDARRMITDIRKSDEWCRQQPVKGNCTKHIERYYYDYYSSKCLTFRYSGCDGNKNNFPSADICQRQCEGLWTSQKIMDSSEPEVFCSLQVHGGYCLAWMPRYYYDVNERSCKKFIYGGCGGNQNRFGTRRLCMKTCGYNQEKIIVLT